MCTRHDHLMALLHCLEKGLVTRPPNPVVFGYIRLRIVVVDESGQGIGLHVWLGSYQICKHSLRWLFRLSQCRS